MRSFDDIFSRFDAIHECDRQTDRQTDGRTDRHATMTSSALCITSCGTKTQTNYTKYVLSAKPITLITARKHTKKRMYHTNFNDK